MKENSGALVASVTPGSPAAKAGMLDGDVILKFDGKDVSTMRDLPRLVATTPIGSDVDVEVLRKGQRSTLQVAVGRLIEQAHPGKTSTKEPPGPDQSAGSPSARPRLCEEDLQVHLEAVERRLRQAHREQHAAP